MKTAQQLIDEAKAAIRQVSPREVLEQLQRGDSIVLVDIREQNEWSLGHLPNALYIGRGVLEREVEQRVPRDANIVLYCASGNRSALAARVLEEMGYTSVASMSGGIREWVDRGGAVED
ncbi:MAG: rhodanese-like domain-containing protein [Gemmatimonas sp.]